MNIKNHFNLWTLIIPIILFACNRNEDPPNPPINQGDMWKCHHEISWDSLKTKNTLIGEWEWEYIGCYWNPEDANNDEFKGLTIEFKADNKLEVRENGQIAQTSNWRVVKGDSDTFAIDVSPSSGLLYGRILFCGDRVEFNHSFIDGCDNYFKRKK